MVQFVVLSDSMHRYTRLRTHNRRSNASLDGVLVLNKFLLALPNRASSETQMGMAASRKIASFCPTQSFVRSFRNEFQVPWSPSSGRLMDVDKACPFREFLPATALEYGLNRQQEHEQADRYAGAARDEPRSAFGTVDGAQEDEQGAEAGQRQARADDAGHSCLGLFVTPDRHLGRACSTLVGSRASQLVLDRVYLQRKDGQVRGRQGECIGNLREAMDGRRKAGYCAVCPA